MLEICPFNSLDFCCVDRLTFELWLWLNWAFCGTLLNHICRILIFCRQLWWFFLVAPHAVFDLPECQLVEWWRRGGCRPARILKLVILPKITGLLKGWFGRVGQKQRFGTVSFFGIFAWESHPLEATKRGSFVRKSKRHLLPICRFAGEVRNFQQPGFSFKSDLTNIWR